MPAAINEEARLAAVVLKLRSPSIELIGGGGGGEENRNEGCSTVMHIGYFILLYPVKCHIIYVQN